MPAPFEAPNTGGGASFEADPATVDAPITAVNDNDDDNDDEAIATVGGGAVYGSCQRAAQRARSRWRSSANDGC